MGWRGKNNRDEEACALWRALPLRERYDWRGIDVTLAAVAAALALLFFLS